MEPDELARQLIDAHRFAHVEHIDLAFGPGIALGQGAGAQHQARGLLDGHEVSDHVRVGDGHRPAEADLAFEQGHHRAGGAEDVAEPDDGDPGPSAGGYGMDAALGDALGRPHHIGRVDGLVGGDEHQGFAAVPRQPGHVDRAPYVGEHRLGRVELHQGHVLQRRRV